METIKSLVIGPVIGKVTQDSARILAEFNFSGEVTCILTDKAGQVHKTKVLAQNNRPIVFKFSGLSPETKYTVTLDPKVTQPSSSFRTLKKIPDGNLKAVIISCNEGTMARKKPKKSDLWANLADRARRGEVDYAFHIGDQIYMDMGENEAEQPYQKSMALLKDLPKQDWKNHREEILELLRGKYRLTWGHPATQEALANVPNLTIVDDHEIRDDWGFRVEDWNPESSKPDWWYGELCRQVYYEYQRALRDDVTVEQADCEYWLEILNGVGVICIEYRAIRTWHRKVSGIEKLHLGQKQTDFINAAFGGSGAFENVKSVLFLSTLTFILIGQVFLEINAKSNDDATENWNYLDSRTGEFVSLLECVKKWKEAVKGREVTLIAGDVHFGVHTEIMHNHTPFLKQFIASAMNQTELKRYEKFVLKTFSKVKNDINQDYEFYHIKMERDNNYGVVEVHNKESGPVHTCYLQAASNDESVKKKMKFTSNHFKHGSGCCSIF